MIKLIYSEFLPFPSDTLQIKFIAIFREQGFK